MPEYPGYNFEPKYLRPALTNAQAIYANYQQWSLQLVQRVVNWDKEVRYDRIGQAVQDFTREFNESFLAQARQEMNQWLAGPDSLTELERRLNHQVTSSTRQFEGQLREALGRVRRIDYHYVPARGAANGSPDAFRALKRGIHAEVATIMRKVNGYLYDYQKFTEKGNMALRPFYAMEVRVIRIYAAVIQQYANDLGTALDLAVRQVYQTQAELKTSGRRITSDAAIREAGTSAYRAFKTGLNNRFSGKL